jgi:hypothetical protein
MTLQCKLEKLLKTRNRAAVSREAGINPATLRSVAYAKNFEWSTIVALARVLECDVGWLVSDLTDFPIMRPKAAESSQRKIPSAA